MSKEKKHRLLRFFAAIIPAAIIISIFLIPSLLQKDANITSITFTIERKEGDQETLHLQGNFEEELPQYETLWIFAENAQVQIKMGGEVFRFHEQGNIPDIFRSPGSSWFPVVSPGITPGETVDMVIRSYYGESNRAADHLLQNLYMGDGMGLYRLMLNQIDFLGIISLSVMIAGVAFLMEGAIDMMIGIGQEGRRVALYGAYCFTGGSWCVADMVYPYLSLMISPAYVANFLDMLSVLLFPVVLALIVRHYIRGKVLGKIISVIVFLELGVTITSLLLQMTGKADLMEQQILMGVIAIPSIGTAMICIVLEIKKYKDNYLILLFLTVFPVFVSNLVDGMNLFYSFIPRRTLMQYSFAVSALLLTLQLFSYAKTEIAKKETMNRMEREVSHSRISIILSQIQPHFLYNSLQCIRRLFDSEPSMASQALEHFAHYLRGNLDSLSNTHLISFEKELEHIRDYLYLEKMRFGKKLNIQMNISCESFLLPPLTVQPMIENAIRHGINKKKGGGTLTINGRCVNSSVVITIQDDGIGFDPSEKMADGRPHIGVENTRKRLEMLCGGTLSVESEEGVGTTVTITIPKRENVQ